MWIRRIVSLLALLALTGCASAIGSRLADAPNRSLSVPWFRPKTAELEPVEMFWVDIPEPEAAIYVRLFETEIDDHPPRGTLLVLHGVYADGRETRYFAEAFANAGYRAVLVDLRGHGQSTGRFTTYGAHESRDVSHLIDALEDRGWVRGPVGLFGHSLGAATAILCAGRDARVERVVAVASFASMREIVESVASRWTPFKKKALDEEWIDRILRAAERRGGFDREASNPEASIAKSDAEVLLIHGVEDPLTPFEHSERLRDAAPDRAYLIPLYDAGHIAPIYRLREITALSAISFFNIGSL